MAESRRTYEPEHRAKWNDPIRFIVKAIDNHDALHLETGNRWHRDKANDLRHYLLELKRWLGTQSRSDVLESEDATRAKPK